MELKKFKALQSFTLNRGAIKLSKEKAEGLKKHLVPVSGSPDIFSVKENDSHVYGVPISKGDIFEVDPSLKISAAVATAL